jgi:hypothetical protein
VLHPFGRRAVERGGVFDTRAKAGRAHHRAVAASQAAPRDLVPTRVIEVPAQQLRHLRRSRHPAPHPRHGLFGDGGRGGDVGGARLALRQLGEKLASGVAVGLDDKAVLAVADDLGQSQIETRLCLRTRLHRDAEAGAAGVAAIDRDQKRAPAPRAVVRIGIGAGEQYPVLHRDRAQFAGAHADKGKRLASLGLRDDVQRVADALGSPQALTRDMQKLLPRMRADRIAEQRVVLAAAQPVMPALLLVAPAARQIGERSDVVIDDRPVAHGRPDDAKAAPP